MAKIHIKNVLNIPGESQSIVFAMTSEDVEDLYGVTFDSLPKCEGVLCNHAGIVTLTLRITFSLLVTCDRCLAKSVQEFAIEHSHVVVRSLESEEGYEDYIQARAESIDPTEIALSDILLSLPSKLLCKPDCKGLCPSCGRDWNEGTCNCGTWLNTLA